MPVVDAYGLIEQGQWEALYKALRRSHPMAITSEEELLDAVREAALIFTEEWDLSIQEESLAAVREDWAMIWACIGILQYKIGKG